MLPDGPRRQSRELTPPQRRILLATLVSLLILNPTLAQRGASVPRLGRPSLAMSQPTDTGLLGAVACHSVERSPDPEAGGQKITREWLLGLSARDCICAFRFSPCEIASLVEILDLPDPLITSCGNHVSAFEAFTLLCARLRSAEIQWGLSIKFGRPQSVISEITSELATYIDKRWQHLLGWDVKGVANPVRLKGYADALQAFGAPSGSICGFIDSITLPTCPARFQNLVDTGYQQCHSMKYQGVAAPNGLLIHLYGPEFGAPQDDLGVSAESGLVGMLQEHAMQPGPRADDPPDRRWFQLYGDSNDVLVGPYSGLLDLTPDQRRWKTAMGVRISVEHALRIVAQDWPFLNCVSKQQFLGTRGGVWYRVAVLLSNAANCLTPNQTALRYNCTPPSLEKYFHR